ncbi:hypothetical protein FB45DRAFT_864535 [Roridomyces roridus]|uniref:Uncharacterized protein n=1 Tax=Roridomyces roridus TaxID=1738132 RepID=A0AAD7C1C4_9AGAR|nr:hypothetical protein FB45DRAFT_864535 [Roridomyces roridus]
MYMAYPAADQGENVIGEERKSKRLESFENPFFILGKKQSKKTRLKLFCRGLKRRQADTDWVDGILWWCKGGDNPMVMAAEKRTVKPLTNSQSVSPGPCGAVVVMEAEAVGGYESADNPARSWSVVDGEGLRPLNTWWWLMTEFGRKTTNVNNALFFSLISPLSVPSSRQFLLSDTSSTSQQCYPTPSSQRRFGRGLEVLTGDLQPRSLTCRPGFLPLLKSACVVRETPLGPTHPVGSLPTYDPKYFSFVSLCLISAAIDVRIVGAAAAPSSHSGLRAGVVALLLRVYVHHLVCITFGSTFGGDQAAFLRVKALF